MADTGVAARLALLAALLHRLLARLHLTQRHLPCRRPHLLGLRLALADLDMARRRGEEGGRGTIVVSDLNMGGETFDFVYGRCTGGRHLNASFSPSRTSRHVPLSCASSKSRQHSPGPRYIDYSEQHGPQEKVSM